MKATRHIVGLPVEYAMKATAATAAFLALGAEGGLAEKTMTGYRSLPQAAVELSRLPDKVAGINTLVNDYNTQTAREFTATYGGEAIHRVAESLNGMVEYGAQLAENFQTQPLTTALAAGIAFTGAYTVARAARFWRQKGQGSAVQKVERKLGERLFGRH